MLINTPVADRHSESRSYGYPARGRPCCPRLDNRVTRRRSACRDQGQRWLTAVQAALQICREILTVPDRLAWATLPRPARAVRETRAARRRAAGRVFVTCHSRGCCPRGCRRRAVWRKRLRSTDLSTPRLSSALVCRVLANCSCKMDINPQAHK